MEQREFLVKAKSVIEQAMAFCEKARWEGLLALEGDLDDKICKFAETGLRMLVDGHGACDINKVLTNMIALETDGDERRLKAMWKDAVQHIHEGNNPRILMACLFSHLCDEESKVFRLNWDGDELEFVNPKYADTFQSVLKAALPPQRKKDLFALSMFVQELRLILELAVNLSGKARSEGLAALESAFGQENVDEGNIHDVSGGHDDLADDEIMLDVDDGIDFKKKTPLLADDEIMQKGLRMILDGAESGELDEFFRSALEKYHNAMNQITFDNDLRQKIDKSQQRLNGIRKEALLDIQAGEDTAAIISKIISPLDAAELFGLLQGYSLEDFDEDFFDDLIPEGTKSKKHFSWAFIRIVIKLLGCSEKARREGLLALEEELEDLDNEFLKKGMRLVVDGTDAEIIERIMSNGIRLEQDEETRRLKALMMEGVLAIQRGDNPNIIKQLLLSHADNSELEPVIAEIDDFFKFDCPAADARSFAERAAEILCRTWDYNEKAKREGLLALDDLIDEAEEARRRIFDYGLKFVVNGCDRDTINYILSNIIALEADAEIRRLKTMEKNAILGIEARVNSAHLMHSLAAGMSDDELEKTRAFFGEAEFDKVFWNLPEAAAGEGQELPHGAAEKSIGALDVMDLINRALPFQAARRAAPAQFEDFSRRKSPQTVAFTLALMTGAASGGGVHRAVEILNLVDRKSEMRILDALKNSEPKLAKEIMKNMIVFEDIVMLDDRSIQKVMREVDSYELAKALKSVDIEVQDKIFRNMSKRAAGMLKEDMEYMGPIRLKDVEEAQMKIISIIQHLEATGEIVIARSGEEELVV